MPATLPLEVGVIHQEVKGYVKAGLKASIGVFLAKLNQKAQLGQDPTEAEAKKILHSMKAYIRVGGEVKANLKARGDPNGIDGTLKCKKVPNGKYFDLILYFDMPADTSMPKGERQWFFLVESISKSHPNYTKYLPGLFELSIYHLGGKKPDIVTSTGRWLVTNTKEFCKLHGIRDWEKFADSAEGSDAAEESE